MEVQRGDCGKSVKVKPGLPWSLQEAGEPRDLFIPLTIQNHGIAAEESRYQGLEIGQKGKGVAVNKPERSWRSEKCFDIRHGDTVWNWPSWFSVLFGPVFSYYAPFPPIWNSMSICWKYVICAMILVLQEIMVKKL